jgi:uncharacterized protein (DUF2236 family)
VISVTNADPVACRVNGERLVVLGWSRAILLQLAHPLIAAGVFEHSGFRSSPFAAIERLHHTTRAMLAITFGDTGQRDAAIEGIRRIHTRVNGTLPEAAGPFAAGTHYSAEDPALLLWVHATLVESMVVTYEHLVGPLRPADLDAYCEQSAPSSIALGVRPGEIPMTWTALQDCLHRTYASGVIVVSSQARELAEALLRAPLLRVLSPVGAVTSLLARGLLPPAVRADYGLSWNDRDARRFSRLTRTARVARNLTPGLLSRFAAARRVRTRLPSGQ